MPNPPFSSARQVGTPHKNNGFYEYPKGGSTIATDYSHSPIGGTIDHVDPPLDVANCRAIKNTSLTLKSQVVYSKQPKLGLTQEFVVDCAHALWVVRSIKRLVSLMLLKWFLSDSFIYFMYRMFNEKI